MTLVNIMVDPDPVVEEVVADFPIYRQVRTEYVCHSELLLTKAIDEQRELQVTLTRLTPTEQEVFPTLENETEIRCINRPSEDKVFDSADHFFGRGKYELKAETFERKFAEAMATAIRWHKCQATQPA